MGEQHIKQPEWTKHEEIESAGDKIGNILSQTQHGRPGFIVFWYQLGVMSFMFRH